MVAIGFEGGRIEEHPEDGTLRVYVTEPLDESAVVRLYAHGFRWDALGFWVAELTEGTRFRAGRALGARMFVPKAEIEMEVGRIRLRPCASCGARTTPDGERTCDRCRREDLKP